MSKPIPSVLVVGAGATGLAAALALARSSARDLRIGLVGQRDACAGNGRTAALFSGSMALIRALGIWPKLEAYCAPILGIRIVDDTGRLWRAPEITFRARDAGLDEFGWNVPNGALVEALWDAVEASALIDVIGEGAVEGLEPGAEGVRVLLAGSRVLNARLVVAADGAGSICRKGAGIGARTWRYEQTAITTIFAHSRAHQGISTEFQRRAGPCTTVPMPGLRSSLVWVEQKAEALRLAALGDEPFRSALETRLAGLLGSIGEIGSRQVFPLSGLAADSMAARRVVLTGEAGHVMPPIGAQGLNLSFRDVAWLAEYVGDAAKRGDDPGGALVLSAYRGARERDVVTRIAAVDALNRSLVSELLPVALVRGLGLHVLGAAPGLKRLVIEQGLASSGRLPRLMQQ